MDLIINNKLISKYTTQYNYTYGGNNILEHITYIYFDTLNIVKKIETNNLESSLLYYKKISDNIPSLSLEHIRLILIIYQIKDIIKYPSLFDK